MCWTFKMEYQVWWHTSAISVLERRVAGGSDSQAMAVEIDSSASKVLAGKIEEYLSSIFSTLIKARHCGACLKPQHWGSTHGKMPRPCWPPQNKVESGWERHLKAHAHAGAPTCQFKVILGYKASMYEVSKYLELQKTLSQEKTKPNTHGPDL